ncbi:MAG: TIGR03915 family putative DNA repair protein [Treponema sp.]|nr:TIGR03915 family putative DNA repair protein [Treponema sp.]
MALLDRLWSEWSTHGGPVEDTVPRRVRRLVPAKAPAQAGLFDDAEPAPVLAMPPVPSGPWQLPDPAFLDNAAGILFQVSVDAYDALVYVWMSGLPLEAQALRYALRVLWAAREAAAREAAAREAAAQGAAARETAPAAQSAALAAPQPGVPWYGGEEARLAASKAAWDRGNADCREVLALGYKVAHEIDRLMGFLRFSPNAQGRYVARCAPDYFCLPALASHFTKRFGDTPWAVIDEKRGVALVREGIIDAALAAPGQAPDPWEDLWRSYHRTVNIESRKNLVLQRQFMPLRYRKYLTEL